MIAEKHQKAAEKILQVILKNRKDKYIVAISGESGSGKSELTHVLARLLRKNGIMAKPIHIDNFYTTLPVERTAHRVKHGIKQSVGMQEYRWDLINQTIDDFKNNRRSTMPCVDLVTEQVDELTTDFNGIEMLIIDGLYAINTENADFRVMIELTYHETKKAQADRGKEPTNPTRWEILEQEHQVVQSLRPLANLFVTKEYDVVKAD